jgi:thiol-disulfide isomerase/thioredoxin
MSLICLSDGYPSAVSLNFWIAPCKKIKITGKDKLFHLWEVKSSVSRQKEANLYSNKTRNILREMAKLNLEINNLRTKAKGASLSNEAHAYESTADSLEVINTSLKTKEVLFNMNIMEKMDISTIWIDKMSEVSIRVKYAKSDDKYFDELHKKAEALYYRMSEEDRNTPKGYGITANLFPPAVVEVGDEMADSNFFDINENTKSLSDYSGKYMLLDFWNSGCGPCIMAFPEMKEIFETYQENLNIISISLDDDNAWKAAMNIHNTPWINIRDPKAWGGLAAYYGANGIPYYVIISPDGKVVDKWFGYADGLIRGKVKDNVK